MLCCLTCVLDVITLNLINDRESFTSFHVQAVVPVILVKPIDTLPLAFVNMLPPTNILTSLST